LVLNKRVKDKKNLQQMSQNTSLVVWGQNLISQVGSGRFTKQVSNMIKLPPYQKSVIIGLILSDGWFSFASPNHKNARLGFSQSLAHSEYVWFVFSLLSHYCSSYPMLRNRTRLNKEIKALEFSTRSLPCFTELYSLFYLNGVKIIPEDIYNMLTPIALAHLIMGDGYYVNKGILLCTECYSIQDVVRLMNVLIIRYNLKCTLHKVSYNRGYRIYRNSIWKVKEIIKRVIFTRGRVVYLFCFFLMKNKNFRLREWVQESQ
jgi:hypothetical protein